MDHNVVFYIVYTLLYGIILLIGEGMYRYLKMNPAWSRNFSHLVAGLVSLPFPWFFNSHWWVLLITVQSSIILILTRKYGLIPSHHHVAGKSFGSFLFFLSIYFCFLAFFFTGNESFFVVPILILTISDVAAGSVGRTYGKQPYGFMKWFGTAHKTKAGTIAFFLSCLVVIFLVYHYYYQAHFLQSVGMAIGIALATSMAEALSPRGFDNFFIPFIALSIMYLIHFM